jgi:hypothetical protein
LLKQALHNASIAQDPAVVAARAALCLLAVDVTGAVGFEDYEARIMTLRRTLIQQTASIGYELPAATTIAEVNLDIQFLQELAQLVIAQAQADPARRPHQLSLHELTEERSARLVFTAKPELALGVLQAPTTTPRACVGFIGARPPQHLLAEDDHITVDACWAVGLHTCMACSCPC